MIDKDRNRKQEKSKQVSSQEAFMPAFFTTFTTVFLAELGDKTQIATLLLTAQSGKPLIVFLGAALALISSSLVGVLLGRWLAKTMPTDRFEYLAGILMVGIGILLGIQATQSILGNFSIG